MIVDSLQNSKHIESLHPLFKKAFDYLKETDFSQVEDGRIETDDPRLSFSITTCRGRDPHDAVLESHERHIDILTPIVGVESIGWKAGDELTIISRPYDAEKSGAFRRILPRGRPCARHRAGQYPQGGRQDRRGVTAGNWPRFS